MTKVSTQIFLIKMTQGTIMSAVQSCELSYSLALAQVTLQQLIWIFASSMLAIEDMVKII